MLELITSDIHRSLITTGGESEREMIRKWVSRSWHRSPAAGDRTQRQVPAGEGTPMSLIWLIWKARGTCQERVEDILQTCIQNSVRKRRKRRRNILHNYTNECHHVVNNDSTWSFHSWSSLSLSSSFSPACLSTTARAQGSHSRILFPSLLLKVFDLSCSNAKPAGRESVFNQPLQMNPAFKGEQNHTSQLAPKASASENN